MSTGTMELDFLEGIGLEEVPPCQVNKYRYIGGELVFLRVCGKPSVTRVCFTCPCPRGARVTFMCQECLSDMKSHTSFICPWCLSRQYTWTEV